LRKVLAGGLCAAMAAAPAVAFAATDDNETSNVNTNRPQAGETVQLRQDAKHKLRTALQRAKHKRAKELRRKRAARRASAPSSASPQLQAIAACESGGNPSAIGGGGAYRGKYQFDYGTWASVGGSGDPAAAPEAEQDKRAAMLLARSGSNPWPVCG
jgi:transglycosylase-like protein